METPYPKDSSQGLAHIHTFKNGHLNTDVKCVLYKALIRSVMT
jgi:hypothetical protein